MAVVSKARIESLDLLKGVVMVLMALDHTRDFFYKSPGLLDVTDPANTTVPLFITRWITHFCAPAFFFLAGLSAYLIGQRKSGEELATFLVKRGIWLVLVEFVIMSFGWRFDIYYHNFDFAVIWALGISMITLAAVIYLPRTMILLFSLVLIVFHNLLDSIQFPGSILWSILHQFNSFPISGNRNINILYPLIPWIGVMSLGYYFGSFYNSSVASERRRKLFNTIAIISLLVFVVLRFTNSYGDPHPWKSLESPRSTILSFFHLNKYPPSLLFLLVTLSGAMLFLANTESVRGRVVKFFSVFGRVPFFYYIIHLYFIHLLAAILAEIEGYGWRIMIQDEIGPDLKGFGYSLPIVYLIWIGVIIVLYPVCKIFDNYKQRNKEKGWLSYL
ncbi:DUF1624 domain-containing protein [Flavihumibacter sp. ZG627]|uniref:DUF1624 domain-containing protein n=1 Tax=Flavihumibacter sp. ZG627 TaxID=1463156 RepID=UPI0005801ECB|nr:heparan-alpha-glucosaminide N-acetyltransferase domain-containing protein [Flavihumibacter sp. ZG627]KIC92088.1 membrane protein [Flavihumibacter sp. ZG627]